MCATATPYTLSPTGQASTGQAHITTGYMRKLPEAVGNVRVMCSRTGLCVCVDSNYHTVSACTPCTNLDVCGGAG